ncbi:WD repeat domain-containing phosphoinositide-interacting protein 4 [Seiridium cupressi]|uniref:WD40-repeat-containing domain protein n=1 Tax=Seiridium unicorne TaxID=138068 RepID=A0ABR2UWC6_9PEZI
MNTRPPIEAPNEPTVLSVAFNNDASRFSVGLDTGLCIFHTSTCALSMSRDFNGGLALVQMMGNSNFIALVGGGRSPKYPTNKVMVWDEIKGKVALEITTLTPIRGVQLTKRHVAVVLQNSVRLYEFAKQPKVLAKYETADNLLGLCCLTDKWLVFPGRTPGQVQVVELATENVSIIPAHASRLQALQLSTNGELLATASEKGTLIRVFSTSSCAKMAERRRGSEFAQIYSLRFSPSGRMLACTSAKGSLHIFDVPVSGRAAASPPQSGVQGAGETATDPSTNRWGFLSNIPFGPFQDTYSFAVAKFELGDEPLGAIPANEGTVLGTTQPIKGVIGWTEEDCLIVVGAGRDARWERFMLANENGSRVLVRRGWKRYLGNAN